MVVCTDDCSINFLWNSFHVAGSISLVKSRRSVEPTCSNLYKVFKLRAWAVHLHVLISYHVWSALAFDHLAKAAFEVKTEDICELSHSAELFTIST